MIRFSGRLLLLAGLGALTLAGCGEAKVDGTKEVAAIAKIAPPAGKKWSEVVRFDDDGAVTMGNPDAPIKLEEYGAFTCSHCAAFAKESSEELKADFIDSGRVSWKFSAFMLHPLDAIAGAVIKCTGPDRYFPLAEATFLAQDAFLQGAMNPPPGLDQIMQQPPEQRFVSFAKALKIDEFYQQRGVPAAAINACLSNVENVAAIEKATNEASTKRNVGGTPTFFINGQETGGIASWGPLRDRLRTMGAR